MTSSSVSFQTERAKYGTLPSRPLYAYSAWISIQLLFYLKQGRTWELKPTKRNLRISVCVLSNMEILKEQFCDSCLGLASKENNCLLYDVWSGVFI